MYIEISVMVVILNIGLHFLAFCIFLFPLMVLVVRWIKIGEQISVLLQEYKHYI